MRSQFDYKQTNRQTDRQTDGFTNSRIARVVWVWPQVIVAHQRNVLLSGCVHLSQGLHGVEDTGPGSMRGDLEMVRGGGGEEEAGRKRREDIHMYLQMIRLLCQPVL